MGDPDPRAAELERTRRSIKRGLGPYRHHLQGLIDHISHMEQGDLDALHGVLDKLEGKEPAGRGEIIEALRAIHSQEQCELDMAREGLLESEPVAEPASPWASVTGRLKRAFLSPRE